MVTGELELRLWAAPGHEPRAATGMPDGGLALTRELLGADTRVSRGDNAVRVEPAGRVSVRVRVPPGALLPTLVFADLTFAAVQREVPPSTREWRVSPGQLGEPWTLASAPNVAAPEWARRWRRKRCRAVERRPAAQPFGTRTTTTYTKHFLAQRRGPPSLATGWRTPPAAHRASTRGDHRSGTDPPEPPPGMALAPAMLAVRKPPRYVPGVSSDAARSPSHPLWQPHPDDRDDVRDAIAGAERGELLSPEASEAFLQWLEGNADDSWRDELE